MDFSLLFDQVHLDDTWKEKLAQDSIYHSIYVFEDHFPELEKMKIVIFSIDDNRGTQNEVLDAGNIRKEFYKLRKSLASYHIADIGCMRPGPNYQDTILRFKEVFSYFIQHAIFPIVLNASQDFVFYSYATCVEENLLEKINIALIDRKLDLEKSNFADEEFVNKIIDFPENRLQRFKLLGYQSYLVNPATKQVFDKLSFEELRLGALKKDVLLAEPMLRNCHLASLDFAALKYQEFPANGTNSPFGLTAEEACQLTWFAGLSNSLKCFIFSGYKETEDLNNLSANGAAVQIWYLIEGFYARIKENLNQDVTEYIVENDQFPEQIRFVKGKKSDKWWVKIKDEFVPCSYKDYLQTQQGILPEVWMREEWK